MQGGRVTDYHSRRVPRWKATGVLRKKKKKKEDESITPDSRDYMVLTRVPERVQGKKIEGGGRQAGMKGKALCSVRRSTYE